MMLDLGSVKSLLQDQETWSRWKIRLESNEKHSLEIALFIRDMETFHAIDAVCPHSGGSLELGDIEDSVVYCPFHSFDFNLNNGKCKMAEQFSVKVYPLHVGTDGRLLLAVEDGDYQLSEIVPVQNISKCKSSQIPSIPKKELDLSFIENVAFDILNTADPQAKVDKTNEAARMWKESLLKMNSPDNTVLDIEPPRTDMTIVTVWKTGKRGKAGSAKSRIALLHSLANIEQWAIDLSWDAVARFSKYPAFSDDSTRRDFYTDFIKVAVEEAKHFSLLKNRLSELDTHYGSLPIHAGLWESATITKDDILARLAIVHMVHEARGLDVNPATISKFQKAGDVASVGILQIIHDEEVGHVAVGQKWFSRFCPVDTVSRFHELVRKHFHGYLKPPFNASDREKAGLSEDWYVPLSHEQEQR